MNRVAAFSTLLAIPAAAWAVYAPIPPVEQGQAFTVTAEAGLIYDDNIFGASTNEVESWVLRVSPKLSYNQSTGDNSFFSAYYRLDALYFENRPTDDTLFNHEFGGKFSYAFDERSELVVSDQLSFVDNPQTTLGTTTLQTDQSYTYNSLNAVLTSGLTETVGVAGKFRHTFFSYDQTALANALDREEWLLGLEASYNQSETTRLVAEIRYQDVDYDVNKPVSSESLFFLVGVDYNLSQVTSVTSRLGMERRDRNMSIGNDSDFYGELLGVHRYAEGSYISAGVRYSTRETDAATDYTDESGILLFANVQHQISGAVSLGASITYLNVDLNPRADRPLVNSIEDKILRVGLSATYLISENFSVVGTIDLDRVTSGNTWREYDRARVGIAGRYVFGLGN